MFLFYFSDRTSEKIMQFVANVIDTCQLHTCKNKCSSNYTSEKIIFSDIDDGRCKCDKLCLINGDCCIDYGMYCTRDINANQPPGELT